MVYITVSILLGLVVVVLGTNKYLNDNARPPAQLKPFKTRHEPDVWTSEQMEFAIQVFHDVWIEHHPEHNKKLLKYLKKLNIFWKAKVWTNNQGAVVAGHLAARDTIVLWHGPELPGYRYRMGYTLLPELLIQYTVFSIEGKVLSEKELAEDYRQIIKQVKDKLHTQVATNALTVH